MDARPSSSCPTPTTHHPTLFRIERDEDSRGHALWVADLADIIKSKRAAGRPRDRAVLEILEKALDEKKKADEA